MYDTVNFDPAALTLALQFAGPDRLLAGSDYPHGIGSLRAMRDSLATLDVSETDQAQIQGGNAAWLFSKPADTI
jgi:aminocarboxymuconate-semialdehyde decarboxylase